MKSTSITWMMLALMASGLVSGGHAATKTPKEIYQMAGPSVVFILASEGAKMGSVGTGSIIRQDGLVITNAHIFTLPGSKRLKSDVSVFLKPDRISGNHKKDLTHRFKGQILAYDTALDLALVRIVEVDRPLQTIEFADASEVVIGDQVYAIGHPEQGGLWSLTTGVISAFRRDYGGITGKNLFQTDASINRGNSGGPLLDVYGGMVGINSLIARKAADGLTITDVNYSIRSDVALSWLDSIGYRFASRKPMVADVAAEPEKPAPPESVPGSPKADQPRPQETPSEEIPAPKIETIEKTPEPPEPDTPPVVEKPPKAPTVAETETPKTEPPQEAKPREETIKPAKPREGKILTRKKPYKMSQLLRDMQEMEDLMDDMRGKIRRYKENQ